jgi:hypothetical protein
MARLGQDGRQGAARSARPDSVRTAGMARLGPAGQGAAGADPFGNPISEDIRVSLRHEQRAEIERIRLAHPEGLLVPSEVVAAAEAEDSPLNSCFTWDDSVAGPLYRIEQARRLIRVFVEVTPREGAEIVTRSYFNLPSDRRVGADHGYRPISAILSDAELRAELLRTALADLESFRRKYAALEELARDIELVHRKFEAKAKAKAKVKAKGKAAPRRTTAVA